MSETDEKENGEMPASADAPDGKRGTGGALRETGAVLPEWLDDCLSGLGAVYSPKNTRYQ